MTKVKGWPNSFIAEYNPFPALREKYGLARRLPRLIKSEKGIRNFSDAASQTLWRICAWFFLSANVTIAANTMKTVDCQRWFAIAVATAAVTSVKCFGIMACPSFQADGVPSLLPSRPRVL